MAKKKRAADEFGESIDDIFGDGGIADIMSDIDDSDSGGFATITDDGMPNALGGNAESDAGNGTQDTQHDDMDVHDGGVMSDGTDGSSTEIRSGIMETHDVTNSGDVAAATSDGELSFDDLRAADEIAGRMSDEETAAREEEPEQKPLSKSAKRRRNKKRRLEQERAAAENATSVTPDSDAGTASARTAVDGATQGTGHSIEVAYGNEPLDAYTSGVTDGDGTQTHGTDGDATVPDGMEEVHLPEWALAIAAKRAAGVTHAFMLSGNVRDYMVRKVSVRDGLIGMLDPTQDTFEVIATYDQASGLQFDLGDRYGAVTPDEYRKRYVRLMHEARQARGIKDDPSDDTIPSDPCNLFEDIGAIFDMDAPSGGGARMLLFVDFFDMLCPEGAALQLSDHDKRLAITIADMCRSYKADAEGSCVFFLTDSIGQVNSTIRDTSNRVDQIIIPQPLTDARRDFVLNVLDVPENTLSDGRHVLHCEEGIDPEHLVVNTAGLACYQIEDIVLRSIADDEPVTAKSVKERKNEIIKNDYHGVLEIMDPKYGFDGLGGMEVQKRFFKDEVIDPIKKGELEAVPMGVLMSGPAGTGKACVANSLIPALSGMCRAGDIRVGDQIFARDGSRTTVLGVFPQGKLDAYRVTLRDGRHVDCSADHLWHVGFKNHGGIKWDDLTVQQMLDKGVLLVDKRGGNRNNTARFYVPTQGCVDYQTSEDQPMPPYALGCFLGDGCHAAHGNILALSSDDEFIVSTVAGMIGAVEYRQRKNGYTWHFYSHDGATVKSSAFGWLSDLLTGTYAKDKHIPTEYLVADREQRLELLRGLMDTDGSIRRADKRYNVVFYTTSERLAHDVASLVYSLGWSAHITCEHRAGQKIAGSEERLGKAYYHKSDTYDVRLLMPNEDKHLVFKLPRKHDLAVEARDVPSPRHHERIAIASIEPLGRKEDMVCFYVDNPEHLFLAGEFVPTHNTVLAKAVAKESNMNCVALNMNSLFSDDSGHAERNLDRALECAMAMAPTIVFIDEIDEALPKRHTGSVSSISNHINKTMLTFLSDTSHRGKVIFIAASNFPEQIDPAMKRAGRFDKRIPIFAPTGYDRVRIIKISCGKAADVNVNGDTVPYEMSCLYSPDKMLKNPFDVKGWLADGGVFDPSYAGDRIQYRYAITDRYGSKQECMVDLPQVLYDIIGKDYITLQAMYRAFFAVFTSLPERGHDNVTNAVEDDDSYYDRIAAMIAGQGKLFMDDDKVMKFVLRYIKYYDRIYSQFIAQTDHMTGAELDVVVQKAINLFRKWRERNADRQRMMIAKGLLRSEKDIPWSVVYEACMKTTNSTAGVKTMEDNALLDTSDLDFIPDAIYGKRNKEFITYKQRLSELRNQQM